MNETLEQQIKKRIEYWLDPVGGASRNVISVTGKEDFIFDMKDMVEAIYKIHKRKKII